MDEDNVSTFRVITSNPPPEKETIPINKYVIVDVDGEEFYGEGFLLFTNQHIAVMHDEGNGAIPILVVPLTRVKFAELLDEDFA